MPKRWNAQAGVWEEQGGGGPHPHMLPASMTAAAASQLVPPAGVVEANPEVEMGEGQLEIDVEAEEVGGELYIEPVD